MTSLPATSTNPTDLTVDQFKKVLPTQLSRTVTQDMVDDVNSLIADPIAREAYRDNLLSYTNVIADGKFKIQSYIDAVRYVSFKLMGDSNITAYAKTFPSRYQQRIDAGCNSKGISAYVAAYNKNKLVNLIFEQTLIPSHIINQDLYQKALNVQAELMMYAKSEKVRSDAADSIIRELRQPEVKKVELDIGIKADKTIEDLRNTTLELVAQQKLMAKAGQMNIKEIAESKIIEGQSEEVFNG